MREFIQGMCMTVVIFTIMIMAIRAFAVALLSMPLGPSCGGEFAAAILIIAGFGAAGLLMEREG